MSKQAADQLIEKGIERCDECNCPVGDDWDYVDFSNKKLTKCPQCGELYIMDNREDSQ